MRISDWSSDVCSSDLTVFAGLPDDARLLCVGAGTGAEIAHLAQRFPGWRFLALDPAPGMLDACRARVERDGFADRCEFPAGLVDTLSDAASFDGATCRSEVRRVGNECVSPCMSWLLRYH